MRNAPARVLLLALFPLFLLLPAHGFAEVKDIEEEGADAVVYNPVPFIFPLRSRVRTDHQSPDRIIDECRAFLKKDGTLELRFPPQLPGYYLGVTIAVKDGKYTASANGVPFAPNGGTSCRVLRQELSLQWSTFPPGEKIEGYCRIDFVETVRAFRSKEENEYYFSWQGPFVAIIREEGFDPLSEAAIKTYDIALAHYELGPSQQAVALSPEPEKLVTRHWEDLPLGGHISAVHGTDKLAIVRRAFWRAHPELKDKPILEVTWDTSPEAQVSDGGIDRLTIWFERDGCQWTQRHFAKWADEEPTPPDEARGAAGK